MIEWLDYDRIQILRQNSIPCHFTVVELTLS